MSCSLAGLASALLRCSGRHGGPINLLEPKHSTQMRSCAENTGSARAPAEQQRLLRAPACPSSLPYSHPFHFQPRHRSGEVKCPFFHPSTSQKPKFRYLSASQVRPVWPNLTTFLFLSQKALLWVGKMDINYCRFKEFKVLKTSGDTKNRFAWSNAAQSG